jgi:hypothetical protein
MISASMVEGKSEVRNQKKEDWSQESEDGIETRNSKTA